VTSEVRVMVTERSRVDGTGDAPVLGKRRLQAEATREQLTNAARELFETRGYQATTVGTITARANTAHGTFYLYFKNKEDAFGQVIADAVDELYVSSVGVLSAHARTESEASIRSFLKVFAVRRALWRCLLEATLQSAAVERMWLDLRRAFTDRSAARLRVLQEEGQIRMIDSELAANALGSMVEWFAFTHFVFGEPESGPRSLDRATAVLHDLWEHAVFGVLPEEAALDTSPRA
jgi:AcrR family transcriptional regulator